MKTLVISAKAEAMRALCGIARVADAQVQAVAFDAQQAQAAAADVVWNIALPEGTLVEDAAETLAALIGQEQPNLVIIEQSVAMRLLAGRLGALLGTSAMDSVTEFTADATVKHLAFGGMAVREERVTTPVALLLVDPNAYDAPEGSGANEQASFDFVAPANPLVPVKVEQKPASGCNLGAAEHVVGIGRGIAEEADLEMVRAFAAALQAEIGCTRPVAEENKWLPRETYIGVSGISLTPSLYVAVGLSGQVQHTIGVDHSGKIVAINKDKNALIFKQCDLGIVGDLYKVLPAVTAALA